MSSGTLQEMSERGPGEESLAVWTQNPESKSGKQNLGSRSAPRDSLQSVSWSVYQNPNQNSESGIQIAPQRPLCAIRRENPDTLRTGVCQVTRASP